jgi:hypothetical protein
VKGRIRKAGIKGITGKERKRKEGKGREGERGRHSPGEQYGPGDRLLWTGE